MAQPLQVNSNLSHIPFQAADASVDTALLSSAPAAPDLLLNFRQFAATAHEVE
jgi:hypothetical protein